MSIIRFVFILLEVLLLFNLLIFVHELGHFLAARWRGLKIDRFAIWFGKPVWKKKINGVEYALGTIPAGGYVALPQMATMDAIEGKSEGSDQPLPPISALDKTIVAFAGPLFSFLLAMFFAVVVMLVGRPVSEAETTTMIGYVDKDGPAAKAGLKPGDRILEVDDRPVTKFGGMGQSVSWRIVRSTGDRVQVKVQRGDQVLEFFPVPVKEQTRFWQRKSLREIKILPKASAIVAEVVPNSPAAVAGIKPRDKVLEVNGAPLYHFGALSDFIESHPGEDLSLTLERNCAPITVTLTPEKPIDSPDAKPRVGIKWDADGEMKLAHPGAIEQVRASVNTMLDTFGALFASKTDIKPQHLGSPVQIMSIYYRLFSSVHGWRQALWFSVLLNVNLALLNLLPIPVLDGGHILLAVLEGIRRKPISARVVGFVQTGFAVLLIGFMLYIAFFDVQDLAWGRGKEKPTPKFAPKPGGTN